jgi:hypothetical protein
MPFALFSIKNVQKERRLSKSSSSLSSLRCDSITAWADSRFLLWFLISLLAIAFSPLCLPTLAQRNMQNFYAHYWLCASERYLNYIGLGGFWRWGNGEMRCLLTGLFCLHRSTLSTVSPYLCGHQAYEKLTVKLQSWDRMIKDSLSSRRTWLGNGQVESDLRAKNLNLEQ